MLQESLSWDRANFKALFVPRRSKMGRLNADQVLISTNFSRCNPRERDTVRTYEM